MADDLRTRRLPTEVSLPFEVMPCQAMRRAHEPGAAPHPCSYFAEWGSYHSYDYPRSGAPDERGIVHLSIYKGKTAPVPEVLSGCRKAPIMAVGINPNLPGYWRATRSALNPLFDETVQYAHYFRYRAIQKLAIRPDRYAALRGNRRDDPTDPTPLVEPGTRLDVEPVDQLMYESYQGLLDDLAKECKLDGHELAVGEDLSYANMVACASAKWLLREDPKNPSMPVMGRETMDGIVDECFHERRYFLRQLFQSLPAVLLVFSGNTRDAFITAMGKSIVEGKPRVGEPIEDLLRRKIVLRYGTLADGSTLDARVIFSPHASGDSERFQLARPLVLAALVEEVREKRLVYRADTKHLARPRGSCVFCTNALYAIGPCDYAAELRPIANAPSDPGAFAASQRDVEQDERDRLLAAFVEDAAAPPAGSPSPDLTGFVVDPLGGRPLVLRGRVVTMDAEDTVIPMADVYVRRGRIEAIVPAGQAGPDGFGKAPLLETRGTMYPGLFDLHNHLAYNVATLWRVPRAYANRGQWQRERSYRENVTMPLDILARHPAAARAIVRYVEVKALLGGTTSVQGMRSRHGALRPFYAGLVRNFEDTDDPKLPHASSMIANLDVKNEEKIASFRAALERYKAYFYHLSEGIDAASRQFYLDLAANDLVTSSLVGIHALALTEEDLSAFVEAGGKVVWSPLSNVLLYGKTIDPRVLARAKVPFALGCDWTPSGSKNLLCELKVASLINDANGSPLSAKDLCAGVTRRPAAHVGWDGVLGTLEPEKYADIVVVYGADEKKDPYEQLIEATERNVNLVLIAGQARYGEADLMKAAHTNANGVELEPLRVGGREKALHLHHPASKINAVSFTGAQRTLDDAASRLHELRDELEAGFGFVRPEHQLLLDNEDELSSEELAAAFAAATLPESIPIDVPTAIDDSRFFETLKDIAHAGGALEGLGRFYGLK